MNRKDLKSCLEADARNYRILGRSFFSRLKSKLISSPISDTTQIWKYIKTLRYAEYYSDNGNIPLRLFYLWRLRNLSYKTGFQIPPHVTSPGLTIYHYGPIIINGKSSIGRNLTIHPQVVIGHKKGEFLAPTIGDNVTIYGGCFIIGNIRIGNNVIIAPNTSVIKDIPDNCIVAGNPAKIIKRL
jgi:serine O-acetyltransferase